MSSILKALKKVEADAAQAVGTGPSQINARGAVSKRARRGFILRRILLVLIVAACLLTGWWAFARYKPVLATWFHKTGPEPKGAEKVAAPRKGPTAGEARTAALRDQAERRRALTRPAGRTPDPSQAVEEQIRRTPPTQGQAALAAPASPAERGPESAPPKGPVSTMPMVKPAQSLRPQTSGVSKEAAASRSYQRPLQPSLQPRAPVTRAEAPDSELEVQAIAWAEDPVRRIAVVNGKVVREGGAVEGFSITAIGLDEVTFKKGNEERKIRCVGGRSSPVSQ